MKNNILYAIFTLALMFIFIGCSNDTETTTADTTVETLSADESVNLFIPQVRTSTVGSGVAINSNILLTFITNINETTANTSSVVLTDSSGTVVSTLVVANGNLLTIAPDVLLTPNTAYTVTLTTALEIFYDTFSTPLDKTYTYDFITGTQLDTTLPDSVSRSPDYGDTNVSINTAIVITLNESLDFVTAPATATINGVSASVKQGDKVLLIRPNKPLNFDTSYTIDITSAQDFSGNPYAESWSFTTQIGPNQVTTWDDNTTVAKGVGTKGGWIILRDNNTSMLEVFEYNNTGITFDSNFPRVFPESPSAISMYNEQLFIASGNYITYFHLYDNNDTIDLNRTVDYNISAMAMNNDRACLLSQDSQTVNLYGIFEQGDYTLNTPLHVSYGVSANECLINNRYAYVTTESNGTLIYDLNDLSITIPTSNIAEATATKGIATSNNTLFYTAGTTLVIQDLNNTPISPTELATFDLNVTLNTLAVGGNFLFVSELNGTQIFVMDVSVPSSPALFHTISTTNTIESFVVSEDFLVILHNGGEELFNIDALTFIISEDLPVSGTPFSIQAFNDNYLISNGDGVEIIDSKGTSLMSIPTTGTALRAFGYLDDLNNSFITVADADAGISIYSVEINTTSYTPVSSITNIGRVYDVFVSRGATNSIQLGVGSSQGLFRYDITTPSVPSLDISDNSLGAIFSVATYLDTNTSTVKLYAADYTNKRVYGYTFYDNFNFALDFNISTSTPPRDISVDPVYGHIFVALGSAGIMTIDSTTFTSQEIATPGFAMGLYADTYTDSYFDGNITVSNTYSEVVIADYTGVTVFDPIDQNGTLLTNFPVSFFIPKSGAIYDIDIISSNNGAPIPIDNNGLITIFGEGNDLASDITLDSNDPTSTITTILNNTDSNITIYDPFF